MITASPKTKFLLKKYWAGKLPTWRVENIRGILDFMVDAQVASFKDKSWAYSHSADKQLKKLFPVFGRTSGEYSWRYSFVLNYNNKLQVIVHTERRRGTDYEVITGDKKVIKDFLRELKGLIDGHV